jgi:NADH dehydrogenase FAD-containing subunit
MGRFPKGIVNRVVASLARRGIEIFEGEYTVEIFDDHILFESGREFETDFVFLATGVEPNPVFRQSGLPTGPGGGLLVNRYLQAVDCPEIFGGGDCIHFQPRPLDKVGVYAVRQNPVLLYNLLSALEGRPLREFDPGGDYLLIFNMGDGTGVLRKNRILFSGKPCFWIKDFIDRKFMAKFQAIERA